MRQLAYSTTTLKTVAPMDDRIISGKPVNSTAGRVVSKGYEYKPKRRMIESHSELPLPVIPIILASSEIDLTGRKVGQLTVIGKHGKKNPKKAALWVVRCLCGRYEHRTAKAIKNVNNTEDRCDECENLRILRKRTQFKGEK